MNNKYVVLGLSKKDNTIYCKIYDLPFKNLEKYEIFYFDKNENDYLLEKEILTFIRSCNNFSSIEELRKIQRLWWSKTLYDLLDKYKYNISQFGISKISSIELSP